MKFQLETMTPQDREVVLGAASEMQRHRLVARRFFDEIAGNLWAIDRATGNYLMAAPPLGATATSSTFLFFMDGHLFDVSSEMYGAKPFQVEPRDLIVDPEKFKQQLSAAFAAHGQYGDPAREGPFRPVFAGGALE
jgi:hypothetical protein